MAPTTVAINAIPAGDVSTTVKLGATVTGGTYDTLSYAWTVSAGSLSSATDAAPTWTRPTSAQTVTIGLTVTANGTGTNAASGTSNAATRVTKTAAVTSRIRALTITGFAAAAIAVSSPAVTVDKPPVDVEITGFTAANITARSPAVENIRFNEVRVSIPYTQNVVDRSDTLAWRDNTNGLGEVTPMSDDGTRRDIYNIYMNTGGLFALRITDRLPIAGEDRDDALSDAWELYSQAVRISCPDVNGGAELTIPGPGTVSSPDRSDPYLYNAGMSSRFQAFISAFNALTSSDDRTLNVTLSDGTVQEVVTEELEIAGFTAANVGVNSPSVQRLTPATESLEITGFTAANVGVNSPSVTVHEPEILDLEIAGFTAANITVSSPSVSTEIVEAETLEIAGFTAANITVSSPSVGVEQAEIIDTRVTDFTAANISVNSPTVTRTTIQHEDLTITGFAAVAIMVSSPDLTTRVAALNIVVRQAIPKITWGAESRHVIYFDNPLDNLVSWSSSLEGSEFVVAPSGETDAWIEDDVYFLEGLVRWIPSVTYNDIKNTIKADATTELTLNRRSGRPITGWDSIIGTGSVQDPEIPGWRAFLEWARLSNAFNFFPHADTDFFIPSYLDEQTIKQKPTLERTDYTRQLVLRIRNTNKSYDGI